MFENLEIIKGDKRDKKSYSFVGIERHKRTKKLEFWLPHGFDYFPDNDFNSKKKLFFGMYKTFRKFLKEHETFFKKHRDEKYYRDGVLIDSKGGFVFKNNDGEEIILYSKLNMIDSILDGYDELKITAILNKHTRSETIDYSKIDKYMHKAIYLPNDVIYIDEMMIPKKVLEYSNTDLIDMYCFIYLDIKESLEEDTDIPPQIKALAQNFKEKYLTPTSSLFEEETSERTINTLKEVLAEIDRNSAYKDDDYLHFFDAIEAFLYGTKVHSNDDDGNYWGINDFSYIWETMCHHYMFKNFKDEILYADSEDHANTKVGGYNIFLKKDFENPFIFQLNDIDSKKHYLRPDIIYKSPNNEKISSLIDSIFKEVKIIGHKFGGIEISKESLLNIISQLINDGFKEEAGFFKTQIGNKQIQVGGRRNSNTIIITNNNYQNIISKVKQKIQDNSIVNKSIFIILDYKYEPLMKFEKSFDDLLSMKIDIGKLKTDIKKQLIYEYALQLQNDTVETKSQFFIPYYFDDKNSKRVGIGKSQDKVGKEIMKSRIEIFKANFMLIQEIYNNDN